MFKCGITGIMSHPSEKANKIVVEKREKVYLNEDGELIGKGWEIVKEVNATNTGLRMWNEKNN